MLFIKIQNHNSKALTPFWINVPMDGEYSTEYFNTFSCNFNDLSFDNIPKLQLENLFKDGRYISPILEHWLDKNTNLIHVSGNKEYDFIDAYKNRYQLKTFTKYGLKFRPSRQLGSGRFRNQKEFENYCNTQTFIIASVIRFPVVKFKLLTGKFLIDRFPIGEITSKNHNFLFPCCKT